MAYPLFESDDSSMTELRGLYAEMEQAHGQMDDANKNLEQFMNEKTPFEIQRRGLFTQTVTKMQKELERLV